MRAPPGTQPGAEDSPQVPDISLQVQGEPPKQQVRATLADGTLPRDSLRTPFLSPQGYMPPSFKIPRKPLKEECRARCALTEVPQGDLKEEGPQSRDSQ